MEKAVLRLAGRKGPYTLISHTQTGCSLAESSVEADGRLFHQQEVALTLIFRMGQMVTFRESESA